MRFAPYEVRGTETSSLLIAEKSDVNTEDKNGKTPLMYAAEGGYTETVALLITNRADINAEDNKGNTPLMHVSKMKFKGIIDLLKKAGAK